jgi:hypothetical protein
VLKASRPSAYVTGVGMLVDSMVNDALTPSQTHVALVVVVGDVVPPDVTAKHVARRCIDRPGWKWEAVMSSSSRLGFLPLRT